MLARSCQNNIRIVVLGAQASPPACVQSNQLNCINAPEPKVSSRSWLLWTRAGEDACAPSTTMLLLSSQHREILHALTNNVVTVYYAKRELHRKRDIGTCQPVRL